MLSELDRVAFAVTSGSGAVGAAEDDAEDDEADDACSAMRLSRASTYSLSATSWGTSAFICSKQT